MNKKDHIKLNFHGKQITLTKLDILPPNTIALSSDLYNEIKNEQKREDNNIRD